MPNLLIVATVPVTVEAFLTPYAAHFRSLGWRVDGMAAGLTASPAAASFDHVWDVGWSRDPLDPRNLWRAAPIVRRIVEREGYDIVHVHTPVAAFVARWALRRLRRSGRPRVVYTAHGFHFAKGLSPVRNAAFLALERLAGRWTDDLVVINQEDLDAAREHRLVPADRVHLMHGIGVDTGRFVPEGVPAGAVDAVRSELGVQRRPLLLMIAEFIPRKRHADVLRALALTGPDIHVAFAGDGPTMPDAVSLARSLGVAGRAHFLGFRRDVRELLAASRATVLASTHEGLPRSTMESLAMGVPAIGPDTRGVRDLLGSGAGILYPPGDIAALAQAMVRLAQDPDLASGMGHLGREMMLREYSLESIVAEHERLYAQALGRRNER